MREKWWFPIAYMFVVTAFFSSIVIGFARFTDERVEANKDLAFEKAVLAVLPGLLEEGPRRELGEAELGADGHVLLQGDVQPLNLPHQGGDRLPGPLG